MKKVLITGANGYVGSYLKKSLKKIYNIKTLGRSDHDDYKINILNKKKLNKFFKRKKFYCIIHCAAKVPGKKKLLNKKNYLENHQMTENLVKFSNCKIIFISSSKVYSNNSRIGYPFQIFCKKIIDYSSSKIFSENEILKKKKDYLILRVPSLIGPNVKNGLLYKIIKENFILKKIPNDNWCILKIDHILKPIKNYLNNKTSRGIYNLGYDIEYSFDYILNTTYKLLNIKTKIKKTKKFSLYLEKQFMKQKFNFYSDLKEYIYLTK